MQEGDKVRYTSLEPVVFGYSPVVKPGDVGTVASVFPGIGIVRVIFPGNVYVSLQYGEVELVMAHKGLC